MGNPPLQSSIQPRDLGRRRHISAFLFQLQKRQKSNTCWHFTSKCVLCNQWLGWHFWPQLFQLQLQKRQKSNTYWHSTFKDVLWNQWLGWVFWPQTLAFLRTSIWLRGQCFGVFWGCKNYLTHLNSTNIKWTEEQDPLGDKKTAK